MQIPTDFKIIERVTVTDHYLSNNSFGETYPVERHMYPAGGKWDLILSFEGIWANHLVTIMPFLNTLYYNNETLRGFVVNFYSNRLQTTIGSIFQLPDLTFNHSIPVMIGNTVMSWWHTCHASRCYWYQPSRRATWLQAEQTCLSKGGHLLSLNTEDEINTIIHWITSGLLVLHPEPKKVLAEMMRENLIYIGMAHTAKVSAVFQI